MSPTTEPRDPWREVAERTGDLLAAVQRLASASKDDPDRTRELKELRRLALDARQTVQRASGATLETTTATTAGEER